MHTVLLLIILLLIITIICYHYEKKVQSKIKNNKFWKGHIKNRTCYYFDDIVKLADFNLDDFLIDEKSHENFSIYNISYKTLIDSKILRIRFNRINGLDI